MQHIEYAYKELVKYGVISPTQEDRNTFLNWVNDHKDELA